MSPDVINPPHYTRFSIEPIDAIESWGLGFHLGAAVKYIARAEHKGARVDDLKKAIWYLEREVQRLSPPMTAPPPPACFCSSLGPCYNCR